jgi:hypothetical protein
VPVAAITFLNSLNFAWQYRVELVLRDVDLIEAAREIHVLVTAQQIDLAHADDRRSRIGSGPMILLRIHSRSRLEHETGGRIGRAAVQSTV